MITAELLNLTPHNLEDLFKAFELSNIAISADSSAEDKVGLEQLNFFKFIESAQANLTSTQREREKNILREIVRNRISKTREAIINLESYLVKQYQADSSEPNERVEGVWFKIEQEAKRLFGDPIRAWAAFEVYMITQKIRDEALEQQSFTSHIIPPERKIVRGSSTFEIVPRIENDLRFFAIEDETPHSQNNHLLVGKLRDLIKLKFLKLVMAEKWWEALDSLQLSERGQHGVFYKENLNVSSWPMLNAAGLFHEFKNHKEWLVFSSFFYNWKISLEKIPEIKKAFEAANLDPAITNKMIAYLDQFITARRTTYPDKDYVRSGDVVTIITFATSPSQEIDELVDRNRRGKQIQGLMTDEFIRLVGDKKLETIYTAFGGFAELRSKLGFPFGFGVTDEYPNIYILKMLEGLTGLKCFTTLAENLINTGDLKEKPTHILVLFYANIAKAIQGTPVALIGEGLHKMMKGDPLDVVINKLQNKYPIVE